MHALILMSPSDHGPADVELQIEHERFIGELDQSNQVVLGGGWNPAAGGYEAAYVVSCKWLDEARAIAASDPLARADAIRCDVVEWELVGVNPDAVDRSSLLYP
jgi:uncharacterized protein YciI